MSGPGDTVAEWSLQLPDGVHSVRFEHGTTSGKRVVAVDGVEVYRKNWMFKLVGSEQFRIGSRVCEISIECEGLTFIYSLTVDGHVLQKFIEAQIKNTRTWLPEVGGKPHRVVLDIETMEVYVNGQKVDSFGEFADAGSETHFAIADHPVLIRSVSSGNKHKGLVHTLVVGGREFEPLVVTADTVQQCSS